MSGLLGIWNQDQETEIDGEKYTPGKLMEIYLRRLYFPSGDRGAGAADQGCDGNCAETFSGPYPGSVSGGRADGICQKPDLGAGL